MEGTSLGRYRIVEELGRGAMGRVFLAHDPDIDRPVAIKTVQALAQLPEDRREEARERFLREARAAGKLLHPGIVTIFDVGEQGGVPYIAMERIEGDTLDRYASEATLLSPATIVELIANVADALHYAHERGIVHRDIKPANLVRVSDSTAKIMDFGLASSTAQPEGADGALMGSPCYMAPEQIRGDEADARSDVFALGCVLYELLTGRRAFDGDSVSTVVYRVVHEQAGSGQAHARPLPEALGPVVEVALAKRRDDRFGSAARFAEALRAAGSRLEPDPGAATTAAVGEAVPVGLPPAPGSRKARASSFPKGLAAVVVIAMLGAAGWAFRDRLGFGGDASDGSVADAASAAPVVAPAARVVVRTEPAGLPVELDGVPLDSDVVELGAEGPWGVLTTADGCRTARHEIVAVDAGGEVVLVVDPGEVEVTAEVSGIAGVRVALNGASASSAPARLSLDLCRENAIRFEAPRHRPADVVVAAGSTPREARALLSGVALEPIPLGTVRLPATDLPVTFFIGGGRVSGRPATVEVEAGEHRLRIVSSDHFLDMTVPVRVEAGATVEPLAAMPALAEVQVQSFPPNCRVSLRRGERDWKFLAATPLARRVAAGSYRVRVEHPDGAVRERDLTLEAGSNPPVRVSFAGSS